MNAGKLGMVQQNLADWRGIAGKKINHARRQPGGFKQFEDVIVAVDRRARRFPDHAIPHQRGG